MQKRFINKVQINNSRFKHNPKVCCYQKSFNNYELLPLDYYEPLAPC